MQEVKGHSIVPSPSGRGRLSNVYMVSDTHHFTLNSPPLSSSKGRPFVVRQAHHERTHVLALKQ